MDIVATALSIIALGFLADHTGRIGRLESQQRGDTPPTEDRENARVRRGLVLIMALGSVALAIGVVRNLLGL